MGARLESFAAHHHDLTLIATRIETPQPEIAGPRVWLQGHADDL